MTDEDQTQSKAAVRSDPVGHSDGIDPQSPPGPSAPVDDESTVGTGSAIALGCVGATLVLIVLGLILLAVFALIR